MLTDKGIILTFKLPALSSTETCTYPLDNLQIGFAAQENLKITALTSGNYAVTKALNSAGTGYNLVVTASGSVSANTLVHVFAIVVAKNDVITLSKDA